MAPVIPSYAMSVFLLPVELCKDLERLMCHFCWRTGSKKDRGIHWISSERFSQRKSKGGIRFHNVRDFNVAWLGSRVGDL